MAAFDDDDDFYDRTKKTTKKRSRTEDDANAPLGYEALAARRDGIVITFFFL